MLIYHDLRKDGMQDLIWNQILDDIPRGTPFMNRVRSVSRIADGAESARTGTEANFEKPRLFFRG